MRHNIINRSISLFTRISYSANEKLFKIYIQGLRTLTHCSGAYQGAYVLFLKESLLFLQNLFTLCIQGLRVLVLALVPVNIITMSNALSTRTWFCLRKYFLIILTRAHSPDIGFCACKYNIQGRMPFLLKPHFLLTKTASHYTTTAQSHRHMVPEVGLRCPF